jgi:capsular polysaccharide biosynthesis protein
MELRQYLEIIRDRAGVVVGTFLVALVVAAASVYLVPQATSTYSAVLTIAVLPQPLPQNTTLYFSDDYYSYVASEYANDDLIAVLQSDQFLQGIRARLPNAPNGSISATKAHRVVNISVGSGTAAGATALAQAVADALLAPDAEKKYFSLLTNRNVTVSVVDGPRLGSQPAGRNALLNLAARALVGLALGIGLAFLLEYLDDSIRPNEAEALLGWPILAEVPGRGLPRTG